jgi:hypothetical protein
MSDSNKFASRERMNLSLQNLAKGLLQKFRKTTHLTHCSALEFAPGRIEIFLLFASEKDREKYEKDFRNMKSEIANYVRISLATSANVELDQFSLSYRAESIEARKRVQAKNRYQTPPGDAGDAAEYFAKIDAGVDAIEKNCTKFFQSLCGEEADRVHVLAEKMHRFRVYFFFKTNDSLAASEKSSVRESLKNFVKSEVERIGRGGEEENSFDFEFDSDENVQERFDGDYYLRLR